MLYYINIFNIFSIFGFIIESLIKIFNPTVNNDSMYGPWLTIYGFGACIIIFIMRFVFNKFKLNRYLKIIIFFLISTFTLTLLELGGGYIAKLLFGKDMWNYNSFKYHIGSYICVEMSLIWGIFSLILIYFLKPILDRIIKKIPNYISYGIFVLIIIDIIVSIIIPKV